MNATRNFCLVAAAALATACSPAFGQAQNNAPAPYASENNSMAFRENSPDARFARAAVLAGSAEEQLGQLAEKNASSASVKEYARMVAEDHGKANDQLHQLVIKDGVKVRDGMKQPDHSTYDRLSKMSGAQFDQAFVKQMVEDHQKAVELFQQEISDGQNADFKKFAADTLPALQRHLERAQSLQQSTEGH